MPDTLNPTSLTRGRAYDDATNRATGRGRRSGETLDPAPQDHLNARPPSSTAESQTTSGNREPTRTTPAPIRRKPVGSSMLSQPPAFAPGALPPAYAEPTPPSGPLVPLLPHEIAVGQELIDSGYLNWEQVDQLAAHHGYQPMPTPGDESALNGLRNALTQPKSVLQAFDHEAGPEPDGLERFARGALKTALTVPLLVERARKALPGSPPANAVRRHPFEAALAHARANVARPEPDHAERQAAQARLPQPTLPAEREPAPPYTLERDF